MLWLVIELFEAEFKLAIDCESPVLPCCDPLLEATVETLFEIESLFLADVELKQSIHFPTMTSHLLLIVIVLSTQIGSPNPQSKMR